MTPSSVGQSRQTGDHSRARQQPARPGQTPGYNISDDDIVELNIPTGMPLVYELDDEFKPIKHYYLGSEEEVAKAMQAVANQGKVKK